MTNGKASYHIEIMKRLMMLTYICYSVCSWGMYLCYKTYTSSYRVVSIRSQQEKHVYLQPRDLHSYIDLVPLHQIYLCIPVAYNVN
jgi:hypothetical protein